MAASCWSAALFLALAICAAEGSSDPLEGSVRLSGGNTDAGRVELFLQGRWGWLCLPPAMGRWSTVEAGVVCRQLGLRHGLSTMQMENGPEEQLLPIHSVTCNGTEGSLVDCHMQQGDPEHAVCQGGAAAGIRCTNFVPEEQPAVELSGAAPESILTDTAFRLACASQPLECNEAPEGFPTFACTVHEDRHGGEVCSTHGRCAPNTAAPNPFDLGTALEAFVFKEPMDTCLRRTRQDFEVAAARDRLGQLSGEILKVARWSEVGIDISCTLPAFRDSSACAGRWTGEGPPDVLEMATLRGLYFSPIARLLFDLDAHVIGLTGPKTSQGFGATLLPRARKMYEALEEDGVATLADAGVSEDVLSEALDALGEGAHADRLTAVRTPLPLLERWLESNAVLQAALAAYFGGHAILHGYKVVHLPATLTTKDFISAHWHHDRAGRRLKLFILLDDVDEQEGHPTQVAKGSHKLSYYWHEDFAQSRYEDSFVQSRFETVKMAGRKGMTYVFDTNSLHRGTPQGSMQRNVIVLEFHQAAKCGLISKMGLNIPCPSGDQRPLNWYFSLDDTAGGRSSAPMVTATA